MTSITAAAAVGRESPGSAVFSAYDLEANVVTDWFTPELEDIALAFGATPCAKPDPPEGFGFLAGFKSAWEVHFPDYVAGRRWRRYSD